MTQEIVLAVLASGGLWSVVNVIVAAWLDGRREKRAEARGEGERMEAHSRALRGLLYGELEKRCTDFIKKGRISAAELNDLRKYYYEPYHDGLNGDGTIEALFGRVENLPVE